MARAAPNDEQAQLRRRARRRLIGAIALAIVIAVVLPWVLESEPRPSDQDISIQIPSSDTSSFDPRTNPAKDAAPKPENSTESPAPASDAAADDTLQAEQGKVLAAPEKAASQKAAADKAAGEKTAQKETAPAAEPKRSTADKVDGRQFVVQVAALADADKARDIQQELATRGLRAYTEKVKAGNGEVTRVRVGPFPSREAAEKERARLKSLGFEGNVAPR